MVKHSTQRRTNKRSSHLLSSQSQQKRGEIDESNLSSRYWPCFLQCAKCATYGLILRQTDSLRPCFPLLPLSHVHLIPVVCVGMEAGLSGLTQQAGSLRRPVRPWRQPRPPLFPGGLGRADNVDQPCAISHFKLQIKSGCTLYADFLSDPLDPARPNPFQTNDGIGISSLSLTFWPKLKST